MKIISGGQTGVDRAGLDAALSLDVECGGWCPAGRLAEDGTIPQRYPLEELPGGSYAQRTERNVSDADGTAIIYFGALRGGTRETACLCEEKKKPLLALDTSKLDAAEAASRLREFVDAEKIRILNIAGPRASEWAGGYDLALKVLTQFLQPLKGDAVSPALSFIIPAHNEEHELPRTLRAVCTAAEASKEAYEVIVVDDASSDTTAAIAGRLGAKVVAVNRRHIAAVRNAGARVARGEILFFVDADTRIAPSHVVEGIDALARGCAGGSARIAVDRALPIWARVFIKVFCTLYFAAGLGVGAFIFTRRASFEAVGGFDEQYFAGEEVYLTLALKKLGPFKILPEPIITSARKIRMHSPWFVLAQSFFIIFGGPWALRKREKLDLWYDGRRETTSG